MKKSIIILAVLFVAKVGLFAQANHVNLNILNNDTTICMGMSALLDMEFDTTLFETSAYTVQQIPHTPYPTAGTNVTPSLVDDHYWGPFPIGFTFCFFGEEYTQFYVGANGWISFLPLSSATFDPWVTQAIPFAVPDLSYPRACVMAPHRDWDPGVVGSIKWIAWGQPGNKKLMVSWIDVALFSGACNSLHGTYQVVLHQSTNYIDNHLIGVPVCPTWNSGNGVQGIMDHTQSQAYTVTGRNNTAWQASAESWRFKPSGPPQPNDFIWTANGTPIDTGVTNVLVTPTVPTEYICKYEPCGAFFADTVVVTPQVCGEISGSHTDALCFGEASGTATVHVSEGIAPYDYIWTNVADSSVVSTLMGTSDTVNTATNLMAGTYYVEIIMFGGGHALDTTITITEPPQVELSLSATPETCPNASDGTILATVTNGIPPFVFACQGQGNSGPTNFVEYTFENLPTDVYNVSVTDANGCLGTALVQVEELHLEYSTSQTDIQCHGDTNALAYINVSGGIAPYNYTWLPIGGNTPGLTNLGAGTYWVTVTDQNGCQINTSLTFSEPPPVNIYTSGDRTICYSQEADITTVAVGGTPPYTYHWAPGGYPDPVITVDPVEDEEYCVYVTDTFGCTSDPRCVTVFVNPPLDIKAFAEDDTICQGDTTKIFATAEGGNGGPYIYELFDGPVVAPPFEVSPNLTTKFIVIGQDNCNTPIVKDTVLITVLPAPAANITSSVIKGCQPLTIYFNENSPQEGQNYFWDFGDTDEFNYSTQKNPVHTYLNPGIYEVDLTITSPNNCETKAALHEDIIVYQKPISAFFVDPTRASLIDPVFNFSNQSVDVHTSFWAFGDGDSVMTHSPFPHTYDPVPGKYTVSLIVESHDGCRDTSYQVITIDEQEDIFYIPTGFNPFSIRPENRVFKPQISLLDPTHYHMFIYNRWGELIFESENYEEGWDGMKDKESAYPVGAYVWLIKFRDLNGTEYRETGSVTIIH